MVSATTAGIVLILNTTMILANLTVMFLGGNQIRKDIKR